MENHLLYIEILERLRHLILQDPNKALPHVETFIVQLKAEVEQYEQEQIDKAKSELFYDVDGNEVRLGE